MPTTPQHSSSGGVAMLLWRRMIWRHWKSEFRLTALLVGVLALGVAVFLSIRLANKAAVSGFTLFTESISGESDFIIRSPAGKIELEDLVALRKQMGATPMGVFPVAEKSGVLIGEGENGLLRVVGTDLVALQNLRNYTESLTNIAAPADSPMLNRSDAGFVGQEFLDRWGGKAGDSFQVAINGRSVDLEIMGVLPADPNRPEVPDNLILMDLPGLLEASGDESLTRIELRIPPGEHEKKNRGTATSLLTSFADEHDLLLETPEQRKDSITTMSAAFRLNLAILSMLSLLVGLYLIMQAMEAAVIKRRGEIAILRSLGVTPRQIRAAWMVESLVLGVVGSISGIVLGRLLAEGLVGAIAQTVNTLYYETTTTAVSLSGGEIAFSFGFGVVASVLAGVVPSREASTTPPAQVMKQGTAGGGFRILEEWGWGIALGVIATIFALQPAFHTDDGVAIPVGGYVASALIVLAFTFLIGVLFPLVSKGLGRFRKTAMCSYAASQLRNPGGRHRLTAAGLAAAIGMAAAMGILVKSFESTLTSWIEQMLKADLYVSAPGSNSLVNENVIPKDMWTRIEAMPGVDGVDKLRRYSISLGEREVYLGGSDYHDDPERYLQLIWSQEPQETGPNALANRNGDVFPAWGSEALQRKFGLEKGDRFAIPTPQGERQVELTGVYADYGNETGTIIVHRTFLREWFDDDDVSQMAIYLTEGSAPDEVTEAIQREFPLLNVRTNQRLRAESLRIFHQTFAVTYALEAIAVFIAVSGLGMALAGLLLERRNELSTLKSLGATRHDIAKAALWEGVGLSLVGLTGGFLMSFLLGWILIDVINPQSFGWTLMYRVPWVSFVALAIITMVTAGGVAWFVGYRNANLQSDRRE